MLISKYLSGILDANIGDSEGMNGPVQVVSLLRFPQWQTLSQSSFINLDDSNASLFKVFYFVLDGQSNLIGGFRSADGFTNIIRHNNLVNIVATHITRVWILYLPRLIVSNKGPVENGNRAGKHSLHWAFGKALSYR